MLTFASAPPTGTAGSRVKVVEIPLAGGSRAEWHYDVGSGAYQRFVDAQPALAAGGRLIRSTNVVVLWVPPARRGRGACWPAAGGPPCSWKDASSSGSWEASAGPPVLRDVDGLPIELQPGNTWYQVVGTATNIVLR